MAKVLRYTGEKTERVPPHSIDHVTHTARHFFEFHNAMPLFEHCHKVATRAREVSMVEPAAIEAFDHEDDSKSERACANSFLHQIMMFHVVRASRVASILSSCQEHSSYIPDMLMGVGLLHELNVFNQLTSLNRSGAELPEYQDVLNGGKHPSLALLAMLADYAVTHVDPNTRGFIGPQSSLFRTYDSESSAHQALVNDAVAGEKILAPIAELFGYSSLAGDILRHAYHTNHPLIHDHVMSLFQDSAGLESLAKTQKIVEQLKDEVAQKLNGNGFDVEIMFRSHKHPGKMMRKIFRSITEAHLNQIGIKCNKLEGDMCCYSLPVEAIEQRINTYSMNTFYDSVAMKIVLKSYKGQKIDDMDVEQRDLAILEARLFVDRCIGSKCNELGYKFNSQFREKPNGYKGWHVDTTLYPVHLLPFEVQLKTEEWHRIAEQGGAAHYLYLGGNPSLIDVVKAKYHDIVHQGLNGHCK